MDHVCFSGDVPSVPDKTETHCSVATGREALEAIVSPAIRTCFLVAVTTSLGSSGWMAKLEEKERKVGGWNVASCGEREKAEGTYSRGGGRA